MKCQNGTCEHTAYERTLIRLRLENEALLADYAAFKALAKDFRECKVDIGDSFGVAYGRFEEACKRFDDLVDSANKSKES